MQGIIILILNLTKLLTKRLLMVSSGRPLFSIDIHPDGSRFVIGGQGEYEFFLIFSSHKYFTLSLHVNLLLLAAL